MTPASHGWTTAAIISKAPRSSSSQRYSQKLLPFARFLLQEDWTAVLVQQERPDAPRVAVRFSEEAYAPLPQPLVGCVYIVGAQRQDRRPVGPADQGLLVVVFGLLQDDPGPVSRGRDRDPACAAFAIGLVLDLLETERVRVEVQSGLLVVDENPGERHVLDHLPTSLFCVQALDVDHESGVFFLPLLDGSVVGSADRQVLAPPLCQTRPFACYLLTTEEWEDHRGRID